MHRWTAKHTGWVITLAVVLIAASDVALLAEARGLTYSEVIRVQTWRGHLWMPLMWGVLGGHFFARGRHVPTWRPLWLLVINVPLIVLGFAGVIVVPWYLMLGALLAGIPLGWYLWGQAPPDEVAARQEVDHALHD